MHLGSRPCWILSDRAPNRNVELYRNYFWNCMAEANGAIHAV